MKGVFLAPCLALCLGATSVQAGFLGEPDAHYYGPLKVQAGVGYKERVLSDGSWRVVADARQEDGPGFSISMALYRAAELAHGQGHKYVQITGGDATGGTTSLYASGVDSPAAPANCKGRSMVPCYTADVTEVMRLLSGPAGDQPGISIARTHDRSGREMIYTAFGIGAVAAAHPLPELGF